MANATRPKSHFETPAGAAPQSRSAEHAAKLARYAHTGQRQVQGWLTNGASTMIGVVDDVQARLGISGNAAEIGIHHGRLFILLYLMTLPGEKAVAIDLFDRQDLNIDAPGKGDRAIFLRNLKRHADTDRLILHAGDSTSIDGAFLRAKAGGGFRLFSVDGGHTEAITAHDLATAERALVPGGVIILDDCFNWHWPGVVSGVHRYFSETRGIVPFAIGADKVLFTTAEHHGHYFDAMLSCRAIVSESEFLGARVVILNFNPTLKGRIRHSAAWRAIRKTALGGMLRRTLAKLRS
jgi:hypothetical protein